MIRLMNRLLALILGAALIVGGVLVIVEGIWNWTNSGFVVIPGRTWLSSFKTTSWSEPLSIVLSLAGAVLGLILLFLQLRPHPHRTIPYRTETAGSWQILRRSAESHLQRRLSAQVPVSPIKARLKPQARRWQLNVTAGAASSSAPALESAGQSELALLHAPGASRVRVRTTRSQS